MLSFFKATNKSAFSQVHGIDNLKNAQEIFYPVYYHFTTIGVFMGGN
jgi:hypothetical protein